MVQIGGGGFARQCNSKMNRLKQKKAKAPPERILKTEVQSSAAANEGYRRMNTGQKKRLTEEASQDTVTPYSCPLQLARWFPKETKQPQPAQGLRPHAGGLGHKMGRRPRGFGRTRGAGARGDGGGNAPKKETPFHYGLARAERNPGENSVEGTPKKMNKNQTVRPPHVIRGEKRTDANPSSSGA